MQSSASTASAYLATLPADRRAALAAVRETILAHLDDDLEEGMQYGNVPQEAAPACKKAAGSSAKKRGKA